MTVPEIRCSFCGRSNRDTKKMISGPRAFICDECVQLCAEIIVDERTPDGSALTVIGDHASTRAELTSRLTASEARARDLESAIRDIVRAVARVTETPKVIGCMWCGVELTDEGSARSHVATCDQHPAVIRLREFEAARTKKRRSRGDE